MLALAIDVEYCNFDFVANVDHFVGMIDPFDPRHLADVNKTFDARFEFHERTISHDIDNFALVLGALRVTLFDVVPWIRFHLLDTQRDFFFFAIDIQNLDVDFLIDRNHFRWMRNSLMRHVGDVQQAVDAAKVNKRTKVRDVLDSTFSDVSFFEFSKQDLTVVFTFTFDQRPTADNNVPSLFIDFKNFTLNDSTNVIANVARTPNVDLACRQKDVDVNVNQQSTLDFSNDPASNNVAFLHVLDNAFPVQDVVGFLFAECDQSLRIIGSTQLVFEVLNQNLDGLTNFWLIGMFIPLVSWNGSFTLKSDIDQNMIRVDSYNLPAYDLVDGVIWNDQFPRIIIFVRVLSEQGNHFIF